MKPDEIFNTPGLEAYEEFYLRILADVRVLVDQESVSSLPYKHAIGVRIARAREELAKIRPLTAEDGWNGELGNLTKRLESDLDYGRTTLNNCYRFASKFPSWNTFAQKEFKVTRGDANGNGNSKVQVLGKDLLWNEVVGFLSGARVTTELRVAMVEESQEHTDRGSNTPDGKLTKRKAIPAPPNPSVFNIPLPIDKLEVFRQLTLQLDTTPESVLAHYIEAYITSKGQLRYI